MKNSLLTCLLPSFLGKEWQRSRGPDPLKTRWLDGLRGLSSLAVCLAHLVGGTHPDLYFAYGDGLEHSKSWLKLPIFRLLYSGDAAVAIFFVVSGYALSCRPLSRSCRERRTAACYADVGSSALRRAARLLLPTLASSFMVMLCAWAGLFASGAAISENFMVFVTAARQPSLLAQFVSWFKETAALFRPWTASLEVDNLSYGVQYWTIPAELRASFVVYLYLVATLQLQPTARRVLLLVSKSYFLLWARWDIFLFLAGMLLADFRFSDGLVPVDGRVIGAETTITGLKTPGPMSSWKGALTAVARVMLCLGGLYLASEPTINAAAAPGWRVINDLVPSTFPEADVGRFWVAIGAVCILYSTERLPFAQWLLLRDWASYLGMISFSLYLVHNAVMGSLGAWLLKLCVGHLGQEAHRTLQWEITVAFIVGLVLLVSIWVADLFHRAVDQPSVRLIKQLAGRLTYQDDHDICIEL